MQIDEFMGRYFDKESLKDILDDNDLSVSGNKDDLIDRIIDEINPSIEDLCEYLDKDDLIDICDDLDLSSSGSRDTLIDRVIEELEGEDEEDEEEEEECTTEEFLRIFLKQYFDKEILQDILDDFDLSTSGNKSKLIERIIDDVKPSISGLCEYLEKDELKEICNDLKLSNSGNKTDLIERITEELEEVEEEEEEEDNEEEDKDDYDEDDISTKGVINFLNNFYPSKRYRREELYEVELASELRQQFGNENVRTQTSIKGGRIDIEVGNIGIELKVPESRSDLHRLVGQVVTYKKHYGKNFIIVIFCDKVSIQDLYEFKNEFENHGVKVVEK
jgi:hypothetical protein